MGQRGVGEPEQRVLHDASGHAAHGQAAPGARDQHVVGGRQGLLRHRGGALRGHQGRPDRPDPPLGGGTGRIRRDGERAGAGPHQHAAAEKRAESHQ
ncbi:hypothetical protein G6F56_014489 [Rhizopus delemar]|nr:hypothetical protein G6F22_021471 [Rhizopus arrhizus]KAG1433865.1 hypothetical protein G6F56_014489 [Rhizopus delemar]